MATSEPSAPVVGVKRGRDCGKQDMNPAVDDPITQDGDMPQKRWYRSRAHCNPLSHNDAFDYPPCPAAMEWASHFPGISQPVVRHVDVGCGFGGLTVELARMFPDKLVLGMEIRDKVCEYVRLRVEALRREHPGQYQNASVLRTNSMLYMPNYFAKGQLEKMFFCFPDPHFKAKNHRRRIISDTLLTEYAYFLAPGGLLYMITDVEDLHKWHVAKADAHPVFQKLTAEEMESDPAVAAMVTHTEEGKKVERSGGSKHWAVYRRRRDDLVRSTVQDWFSTADGGEQCG